LVVSSGCKKRPDGDSPAGPVETHLGDVADADVKPEANPVASPAATTPVADVRSDSPFFPAEEVIKIDLDNEVLSRESAYRALMPALVRFLDSAAETDFPPGTSVMRPAINLSTATYRISYMLVPGEPAVRCYLPDNSMPWLFGDDEAYEELFTALESLVGRKLPRG